MRRFVPALQALGVSSIPLVGVAAAGWSPANALALYWCENLLGALLVCGLIVRHRRLTRKRGHWRAHFGATATLQRGKRSPVREIRLRSLLAEFATTALVFNLAHGLFLAFLLGLALPRVGAAPLDLGTLRPGLAALVLFLLGGAAIHLVGLRDRPFAWMLQRARLSLTRMVLIHLTILFGLFAALWANAAAPFFAVFTWLKLLLDVGLSLGMSLPSGDKPAAEEPPGWMLGLATRNGGKSGEAVREEWRRDLAVQRAAKLADEEEIPAEETPRRQSSARS